MSMTERRLSLQEQAERAVTIRDARVAQNEAFQEQQIRAQHVEALIREVKDRLKVEIQPEEVAWDPQERLATTLIDGLIFGLGNRDWDLHFFPSCPDCNGLGTGWFLKNDYESLGDALRAIREKPESFRCWRCFAEDEDKAPATNPEPAPAPAPTLAEELETLIRRIAREEAGRAVSMSFADRGME